MADGVARRQQAVRPVRGEAAQSRAAGRSRGLPDRRQLAGRDERGGDAVDAGVTEHRAGVSRRQLQVQRVSRQLRQQVEAEGRVWPRGVFLAGAQAAAVSLRHRARRVRAAVVLLSGARTARAVSVVERSARDRRGHLHRSAQRPHAADGRQSDLDQAPRPRHRPELGRDGRKAVESGGARLAGQRFCRAQVRRQASDRDDHDVARLSDAGGGASRRGAGAQLRLPRPGIAATHGGAVRGCDRHDYRRVEHFERPAPGSGEARDDHEPGATDATASASAGPATGLGLAQRRLLRARVPATAPRS